MVLPKVMGLALVKTCRPSSPVSPFIPVDSVDPWHVLPLGVAWQRLTTAPWIPHPPEPLNNGSATRNWPLVATGSRVSHYNVTSFTPDGRHLIMTSLMEGVSQPFLMAIDGTQKRTLSSKEQGFNYGFNASPDGEDLLSRGLSNLRRPQKGWTKKASEYRKPLRLWSFMVTQWH